MLLCQLQYFFHLISHIIYISCNTGAVGDREMLTCPNCPQHILIRWYNIIIVGALFCANNPLPRSYAALFPSSFFSSPGQVIYWLCFPTNRLLFENSLDSSATRALIGRKPGHMLIIFRDEPSLKNNNSDRKSHNSKNRYG